MMNILFILLIVVSQHANSYSLPDYNNLIWKNGVGTIDTEIIDEWSTMIQSGDSVSPGKSFYKAILFTTPGALDRYLKANALASASLLIDVKAGTTCKIMQEPVKKTQIKKEEVINHYNWKTEKKGEK